MLEIEVVECSEPLKYNGEEQVQVFNECFLDISIADVYKDYDLIFEYENCDSFIIIEKDNKTYIKPIINEDISIKVSLKETFYFILIKINVTSCIEKISIIGDFYIEVGLVYEYSLDIYPFDDGSKFTWSVSDEYMALLLLSFNSGNILLKALSSGEILLLVESVDKEFCDQLTIIIEYAPIEKMEIIGEELIILGNTYSYSVSFTPTHSARAVKWFLDNNNAIIDDKGSVTPLLEGEVQIKALVNDELFTTFLVLIVKPLPTEVSIISKKVFYTGESYQFKAIFYPLQANQNGLWTSSNQSVGTISGDGLFKALSIGTTSIRVTGIAGCSGAVIVEVKEAESLEMRNKMILNNHIFKQ
jgi:hypothetical protein